MRNHIVLTICLLALVALAILPDPTTAAVICDVRPGPDPAMITVVVTVDDQMPINDAMRPDENNAVTSAGNCGLSDMPFLTCTWTATQLQPGPSSVTAFFSQDGGETFQDCGPFDNEDGLPVELVEFSVD